MWSVAMISRRSKIPQWADTAHSENASSGMCWAHSGGGVGGGGEHLLWGLRGHFIEDEWAFTRQRMSRIPRETEQHVQRSRSQREVVTEYQMRYVPDEPRKTGFGGGGAGGQAAGQLWPPFLFWPLLPSLHFPTTSLCSRYLFPKQTSSSSHILHG